MSDRSFAKIRFQTKEFSEPQQVDWSLTRNMVPKVTKKNGEHMLIKLVKLVGFKETKRIMHNTYYTIYLKRYITSCHLVFNCPE
jgi:hypothetical protein